MTKYIKTFIRYLLRLYAELFFPSYKFRKDFVIKIFGSSSLLDNEDHFFVGYYDIDPVSEFGESILCHKVSKEYTYDTLPNIGDIGLMSISSGEFIKIIDTKALNWQLGSRAQWLDSDHIIYNDINDGLQVSKKFNIKNQILVKEYHRAFWAISPDKKIGASLNFSRIKEKRPGYGYSGDSIDGEEEKFSLFNLETGHDEYVISLNELFEELGFFPDGDDPYLNHVAWSPCSTKLVTIFHFAEHKDLPRRVYPAIFNILSKKWQILDTNGFFSHNVWLDSNNILAFRRHNNNEGYCLWSFEEGWSMINLSMGKKDGHPSPVNKTNNVVFDEYPNLLGKINLYVGSINSNKPYQSIGFIMNPKEYTGPLRCDLHPRVSKCNSRVICDMPTQKGRKIIMIEGNYVN